MRIPSTGILVGRGCPYRCLFCYKGVWGKSLRFRTPENVLQEIEMCIDQYRIRDFRFYDDTVTFPRWDLKSLCEEIINRKLNISWNCWSRVNDVDEEKLGMMKEAGCYNIKFGIEFGTAKALKLANKGATLEQARRAVAMTKKAGIECKGSFIFGIPGETIEDCRKTIDFAKDISPHFATFFAFDPIPGSPFYERIIQEEINPEKDMLPREMAQDLSNQAYLAFYFRPTFIFQRIHSLFRHPKREILMVSSGLFMLTGFWLKKMKRSVLSTIGMEAATMPEMACDLENKAERLSTFEKMAIRVMDVSVAAAVLFLSLPLIILIAVIIKTDSPGPAIFKQTRMGKDRRNGSPESGWNNGEEFLRERRRKEMWSRPFVFYKFRTMYVDAREKYPELYRYEYSEEEIRNMYFKRVVDPRLTPFGQHLRKTTLDEFPNLINVIKGDMGLVGPRPDIPEMIKYYRGWQRKKFQIKPGVTGLAQINGRGLLNFQDTLKYDVEMVEKYGFWFNVRVILKTIKVTMLRIGAF
jgi:lipopolysaccharide/colanic/teichoic acid biosynthesis glycosyltransferase/MoaA/NifB/PqqE/SkfB family radical SAM enzyme